MTEALRECICSIPVEQPSELRYINDREFHDLMKAASTSDLLEFVDADSIQHLVVQEIAEQDGSFEESQGCCDLFEAFSKLFPERAAWCTRTVIFGLPDIRRDFCEWCINNVY